MFHSGSFGCVDELRDVVEKQIIIGLNEHRSIISRFKNVLEPLGQVCGFDFVLIDLDHAVAVHAQHDDFL